MAWKTSFSKKAERQFAKLPQGVKVQVAAYLQNRVISLLDPRLTGKALTGPLRGYWRYRVGDYRIICDLRDKELIVLVIEIAHRREVYK